MLQPIRLLKNYLCSFWSCPPSSLTSFFMSWGQLGMVLERKEGKYVCREVSGLAPKANTFRRGYNCRSCSCRLKKKSKLYQSNHVPKWERCITATDIFQRCQEEKPDNVLKDIIMTLHLLHLPSFINPAKKYLVLNNGTIIPSHEGMSEKCHGLHSS